MSVKTIFGVILILVSPILSRLGCMGTGVAVAAPAFALGIMLISIGLGKPWILEYSLYIGIIFVIIEFIRQLVISIVERHKTKKNTEINDRNKAEILGQINRSIFWMSVMIVGAIGVLLIMYFLHHAGRRS
ncbi:hypothetical protein NE686_18020 [Tissierella carlieri]|uniref:Uncharacterized protein n=1 Tax=Tissierella carlieri TaxID=689904 RepID=A0ABT1SEU3_9FIRM|nr:hypothetical protein [Tissierella carlieri]MCQ4925003.1 hypothetical protein [Tissierella carlieri]